MLIPSDKMSLYLSLLSLTGCQHLKAKMNMEELIEITQKHWLRPAGSERWDVKDNPLLRKNRSVIFPLLTQLGYTVGVKPSVMHYDCLLLLGASDQHFLSRLHYLQKMWISGVKFKKIYILTGEMPKQYSSRSIIHVYEDFKEKHSQHFCPINPRLIISEYRPPRPNTRDTIKTWLKETNESGRLLFVSNQPFILYQSAVIKNELKAQYSYETVGDNIADNIEIAVILDSVARFLYESFRPTVTAEVPI